jgi:ATP-dependent RNA helicase MSS116
MYGYCCYSWQQLMLLFLVSLWICGSSSASFLLFPTTTNTNTPHHPMLLPLAVDNIHSNDNKEDDKDNSWSPSKAYRGRIRPIRRDHQLSSRVQSLQQTNLQHQVRQEMAQQDPNLLVNQVFADVVSAPTARALQERIGVNQMTLVQARTFALARKGESLLVRARVGTGKTLAFLVPLVERLIAMDATEFQPGKDIGILIVAPTVELARQIEQTVTDLLAFYPTLSTKLVSGGTSLPSDLQSLQKQIPAILIATPGRFVDLLKKERIRGHKLSDILGNTRMVVLDEVDSLASSFKNDVVKILSHLPRKRQTMLFSATIPGHLKTLLPEMCMTTPWSFIDCIKDDHDKTLRVDETFVVLHQIEDYIPSVLLLVCELAKSGQPHKTILFFPAVRMVKFFANILQTAMPNIAIWEIHSQMNQSRRRRLSNLFRRAKHGILLTSDVSARGLDYPDVDIVVQYGLPRTRELYLHRIGRTGRAGSSKGRALLVLMPFEKLETLGKRRKESLTENIDICFEENHLATVQSEFQSIQTQIGQSPSLKASAEGCILAFLAYYAVHKPRTMEPSDIRTMGEELAESIGLPSLPPLLDSLEQSLQ